MSEATNNKPGGHPSSTAVPQPGPAGDAPFIAGSDSVSPAVCEDLQVISVVAGHGGQQLGIKTEPTDSPSDDSGDDSQGDPDEDEGNNDVVYIDQDMKETTVKYLQG